MGIPSPLIAPMASPSKFKAQSSLDFPPLGAVKGVVDESQDLKSRVLKPNPSWADTNSGDESETSTGLKCDNESTELESQSNSSVSKTNAEACQDADVVESEVSAEKQVPASADELLQAKGVMKVDASSLGAQASYTTEGYLVQMLCRIFRDGETGMRIVPCMGDDVYADSDHEVMWCCMQPQMDGAVMIVPCTDAAICGVGVDANGASLYSTEDVVGAPARPAQGSYVPTWVYGTQWPFSAAPTTLILSNIPTDLNQEDLIEIFDKEGFSGFYDFLHLPMDLEFSSNAGYAIVNLTRHEYGLALAALINGRSSWCGNTTAACQVTWSVKSQGLTQLIEHYQGHESCRDNVPTDMRPTWFSNGWPHPLPLEK